MNIRFTELLPLAMILLIVGCIFFPLSNTMAEQTGSFTGSWIASGKKQSLDFGTDREVFTFNLAGHVNLKNAVGEIRDYWSECIGLWDSQAGSSARCVWRDLEGQKAYIVVKGLLVKEGAKETAEFVGGTKKLEGLTGGFTFSWESVFRNRDEGIITGHTENIEGTYHIP